MGFGIFHFGFPPAVRHLRAAICNDAYWVSFNRDNNHHSIALILVKPELADTSHPLGCPRMPNPNSEPLPNRKVIEPRPRRALTPLDQWAGSMASRDV